MDNHMIAANDSNFQEHVLDSDMPVIVDFWAEWCGPCKAIAPLIEQVAKEYAGQIKVVKLDVDHNKETASKYSIKGIPTLILFKGGEVKDTKVGMLTLSQLTAFIDQNI
ncbi:MAG: thioredoxin [Chromatiales bacterium]|nr:thioredoxin [Chromatiales bacterium]